jgi:predicted transposase YdaD
MLGDQQAREQAAEMRIYLNELNRQEQSLGIGLMQLTIAPEAEATAQARRLLERAETESSVGFSTGDIIEMISTILFYKFSSLSREEVERMLGLNIEEIRIYQDLKAEAEGKMKSKVEAKVVKRLANKEIATEEIANLVDLSIEEVQRILQQAESSDS